MLKNFIERPVLSTVISIFFIVLGLISIRTLPVEQYPNIAPPTVRVSTSYSGANAEAVLNSVIIPLEEQINGVEGMTYMTSSATNGGGASISVYFEQDIDPDIAAVNVQNRVAQASSLLPSEVTQNGVTVQKMQSGNILFIQVRSNNEDYDATFLQNYAQINVVPQLKRVKGVGSVDVFGAGDYAMRVWLKPDLMRAYSITYAEINSAMRDQNIEAAPGELGENGDQSFQFSLSYTGRLKTAEQFENIILRTQENGYLRLKDVADVELGAQSYSVITLGNGEPAILLGISQTAGSNAQDIIEEIKGLMVSIGGELPPGVEYQYMRDSSEFLNESISKLTHTLFEVFVLVFIIILVFLQNFRATFIPAIAVPVSVIGTFFFLTIFGFSINLITLFALVLAIGMVVDDAIVVVEAVYAELDAGAKNVKQATIKTMREIAPAIISMTLVASAVFIPVSFLGGTSGVFFRQFGLTMAIAILISGVNALTLSPAMAAIFLKAHKHHEKGEHLNPVERSFGIFNRAFDAATSIYEKILVFLTKEGRRWISVGVVVLFSVILWQMINIVPGGFVPQEDSGGVMGSIKLVPGTSRETTDSVLTQVMEIARDIPGVKNATTMSGRSFTAGSGSSYGGAIVKMDTWSNREITADELVGELTRRTSSIKNAQIMFFSLPTIMGFGLSSGVEIQLQDKTGGSIQDFYEVVANFERKLKTHPEIMTTINSFDPNFPQKQIEADVPKIKQAGLTVSEVMGTLQANIGSMYVSNFNTFGKQYRVIVQASPEYRSNMDDLNLIYVKTASGEMAPITEFINVTDVTGPQGLTRFNLFTSMDLRIIPNFPAGATTADVFRIIDEIGLPRGYGYEFSGMTREEASSSSQTFIIFALSVIFVYLLLAALYESYLLPLAVIFSLPIGLSGIYIFVMGSMMNGSGIVNNIYVQISLIMVIGLLAKTAILIVEYALQRRRQGLDLVDAAISGAVLRLRPVMMTALTMIIGLLPLAFATGAGAMGNKSIGISAIGGMLFGTFIGILIVPVLFIIFQNLQEKLTGVPEPEPESESEISAS